MYCWLLVFILPLISLASITSILVFGACWKSSQQVRQDGPITQADDVTDDVTSTGATTATTVEYIPTWQDT